MEPIITLSEKLSIDFYVASKISYRVRESQSTSFCNELTKQAIGQLHPQLCSGLLPRRLFAQTASATETNVDKPTVAAFSIGAAYDMLSYSCGEIVRLWLRMTPPLVGLPPAVAEFISAWRGVRGGKQSLPSRL